MYYGSQTVPIMEDIPIKEGSLTIDRAADIRRAGSLTIAKDDLNISQFDPMGIEFAIRSGFRYSDDTEELVPLGWFRIEDSGYEDGVNKEVKLNFYDRGKALQDIQTLADRDRSGLTCEAAVNLYVNYTYDILGYRPTVTYGDDLDELKKLPGGSIVSGTHLDAMNQIAQTMNAEWFFDPDGQITFQSMPSITVDTLDSEAVWTVDSGEGGVLVSANRVISRTNTINHIGVFGATSESGNRVWVQLVDSDPNSPTGFFSKFGRRSIRLENDTITSNLVALQVAQQQLKNLSGLSRSVSLTSIWNPALSEGDIILVEYLTSDPELHLVESIALDLVQGEMSLTTRTTQFVE